MNLFGAVAVSRLVLRLGQVYRITEDQHGNRESDTTHTVVLALLAATLAPESAVPLRVERCVLFALVHELVETYAGDTPTLNPLDEGAQQDKETREAAALGRIRHELHLTPWIVEMIEAYERQEEPEARFVRYLDKVLPKLTHQDNQCAAVRKQGVSWVGLMERHQQQGAKLEEQYPEFPKLRRLFEAACTASELVYLLPRQGAA